MPNKFAILLLSGFFLFLTGGVFAQKTALMYADELFEREQIDSAIFYYEVALGKEPSNTDLQVKLADLYYNTNQPKKAIQKYEQLVLAPNVDWLVWYYYAYVLKMDGNYDKAREALLKMKQHPQVVGNASLIQTLEYGINSCDFAQTNLTKTAAFRDITNEKTVNSPYADFAPTFLGGNQLLFASNRILNGLNGVQGNYSDANADFIYIVKRGNNDKVLLEPALLHDIKNSDFASGAADLSPFAFSADGKLLVSSSNSFAAGVRHPMHPNFTGSVFQLSYAKVNNLNELPKLEPIFFENLQINLNAGFPFLVNDGNGMFFSAKGKGLEENYGGFDIYFSRFENGVWSKPFNLGANVNGPGNEVSPFIDEEGALYFSSDGHKGFGGFDVFRSESVGGTWLDVRNLGAGVNSSSDDLYFISDQVNEVVYFCSNRSGGMGDYDVYSAKFVGDVAQMPKVSENEQVYAVKEEPKDQGGFKDAPKTDDLNNADIVGGFDADPRNPNASNPNAKTDKITPSKTTTATKTTDKKPTEAKTATANNNLPCLDNSYIGVVSDAVTKQRIEEVWVFIRNAKTGEEWKTKTSKYGEYAVKLENQTAYEFRCSRQGYENIIFDVFTGDGEKKSLLGEKAMVRAATTAMTENDLGANGLTARGVNVTSAENFLRGPQKGKEMPSKGYQIQIGVFKELSESLQKDLSAEANVLTEPYKNGEAKIYRLGIFADETHAKDILAKVQKMKGLEKSYIKSIDLDSRTSSERMSNDIMLVYPKSAVVKKEEPKKTDVATTAKTDKKATAPLVDINDPMLNVEPDVTEDPKKAQPKVDTKKTDVAVKTTDIKMEEPVAVKEVPTIKENPRTSYADNPADKGTLATRGTKPLEFKIQIGAYKEPEKAKFPDLSSVGLLEKSYNSGNGLTYFFLTGYTTLDDARQAKTKAEQKGVSTPFIVAYKNGQKVALSEVTN